MTRGLADGVHAVHIADELIFLDLASDSYFALRAPAAEVRLDKARGFVSADDRILRELDANGLLHPQGGAARREPRSARLPPPRGTVAAGARVRALDVAQFAASIADAAWLSRRGALRAMVRYAMRRDCDVAASADAETLRRARIFPELLLWSPWQGECLYRSYLLLRFLRAGGCDAAWVFGVRTWPFGAHCWLQVGEVVLNDQPERLRAFSPILVV